MRRTLRTAALTLSVILPMTLSSVSGGSTTGDVAGVAAAAGSEPAAPLPARTKATRRPGALDLPRIPWEGGSAYWRQFPYADRAGWDKRSFFPIVSWFNSMSTDAEARYDKSLGLNTYVGMYEGTPYRLFADNDLYWIGKQLNSTFKADSTNWVGNFLDDEVDGSHELQEGFDYLQSLEDQYEGNGRFNYANYTQIVMSSDLDDRYAEQYVNDYTDTVSLDMYYYTVSFCDWEPWRMPYITPVEQRYCRTSSSYGKSVESLRKRDAADGRRQPIWNFVENLNGGPGEGPWLRNIAPDELRGAVMSSVINEARGIVYFNQSWTGPCQSGNVFRDSMKPGFCGAAQVAAAKKVNLQIQRLARVINTQSYRWKFGRGLDTMLKSKGRNVFVFAMVDGSSDPGARRFKLPAGVAGRTAKVMFEGRSVPVSAKGVFRDSFAQESSYHVYRIRR